MNWRLAMVVAGICALFMLTVSRPGRGCYVIEEKGQWGYVATDPASYFAPWDVEVVPGQVYVYCIHTDVKGRIWSTY